MRTAPTRWIGFHVMPLVAIGAGHALLPAERRAVVGRTRDPLRVRGMAVRAKPVLRIGRTAHFTSARREYPLEVQIRRRKASPFAAREQLQRILGMYPVARSAWDGTARGEILSLHDIGHLPFKKHAVASEAMVGGLPGGVVGLVLKELGS